MAQTKHKQDVTKSRRSSQDMAQPRLHAAKKQKTAHGEGASKSVDKKEARRPPNVDSAGTAKAAVSILREEEPLFPRGGGSVLTPLEQRQIKAEAERDVLFEQAGKGKKRRAPEDDGAGDDDGSGEDHDGQSRVAGSSVAARRPGKATVGSKMAKKNVKQPSKESKVQEPTTKIEGLNYHVSRWLINAMGCC
jgi:rRNA biogenesis protein RRP5